MTADDDDETCPICGAVIVPGCDCDVCGGEDEAMRQIDIIDEAEE